MHDINLALIIHIYINVSKFDAKCIITQFQMLLKNNLKKVQVESFVMQKDSVF